MGLEVGKLILDTAFAWLDAVRLEEQDGHMYGRRRKMEVSLVEGHFLDIWM